MVRRIFFFTFLGTLLLVNGLPIGSATADAADIDPVPLPVWGDELLLPGIEFVTLGAPSMALDPDGRPHIVYGFNHLFHTWFDGVSWQSETIDSSRAWQRESVMAIGHSGTIFIADYENDDLFLRILEPGGSWQTVRAPFPHMVSFSIVLDSNGRPHIVAGPYYYNPDLVFLHGTYELDGWSLEKITIENAYDKQFSIAIDSNDLPVILYERYGANDLGGVWVVRYKEGSWQNDRLAAGCQQSGNSLALDRQDRVHALISEDCDRKLSYVKEDYQGWVTLPVTNDGRDPALALDNLGRPHVVSSANIGQVYAVLNDDFWEKINVQVGEYGAWYNQLLLDNAGAAHIASIDTNLHYATNSGGQWHLSTPAVQKKFGRVNALALDAADTMHVLYHEYEADKLYWASGSIGNLETELLANVPFVGLEIALELDSQGRPHVAYLDGDKNELVTGMRESGVWNLEVITTGGRNLSMAVDSMDRPHLAVVQNGTLSYWIQEEGDWISEAVGEIGSEASAWLALDSQDRPHIAYSDSNGAHFASREGPNNWATEPLPFEKVVKLVFGPGDKPYLLYSESYWVYDGRFTTRFDSIWFAESAGEDWSVELLWEDPDWDIEADLIVQNNNPVRVALRSAFGEHVYLERGDGGAWSSEEVAWPGSGDISMVIGQDGQPRLLTEDGSSLFLSTREIFWLDKFSFMPVLGHDSAFD